MVEYTVLSKQRDDGCRLKAVFIKQGNAFSLRMEEDYGDHTVVTQFIEFTDSKQGNEQYKNLVSDGYRFEGKTTFNF